MNLVCEVVRRPVAHCELNPIEMAWAQVKGYIKEQNKSFTLSEVKRLAIEDHYWEHDGLYKDMME